MKKMGLLKRILSLMLALSITLSCVPVNVLALQTDPVPETTAPAETDPTETTAPADTQPPETTEPAPAETTEVTEPSVPETTVAAEPAFSSTMIMMADASGSRGIVESLWNDRSAVFVGDSITAGSGTDKIYYQYLNETLGFSSVTAMGVAGSCISAASDYGQSNQPLISRYQDIPSADLIVIFMGTNDYGHETSLGSVEDVQDGTFYGALNTIIPALTAKHSSSKIVFVTPLHRYGFGSSKILGTQFTSDSIPNGVGAALKDYVEALKTVCDKHGVSVIDLYTECTLDPADPEVRTNYMPDGLHPNAAGHELIAGIMESHIRGYLPVESTPGAEPEEKTELVYGNKFAAGFDQQNRASSRVNQYLKAGTVITLKNPATFQWACVKTSNENSSDNLGYFPDSAWTDKESAVVEADGWIGFVFKYRDESQSFDLTQPLSAYINIEEQHTHSYEEKVTAPTCIDKGYTTYTCACGDSYVSAYVDAKGHSYKNGICTICGEKTPGLEHKTLSILGASISTYAGTSNGAAADTTNSTIRNNAIYYPHSVVTDVTLNDTWWMQAVNDLGLRLLVNNSWSSSSLLHERGGTVGAYVDRCVQLHDDTGDNAGEMPDIIAIQMGTNDFQYYKDTLGTADIDYDALIQQNSDGSYTYGTPVTSLEAAAIVLHKISVRYPNAEVYYLNISQRVDNTDELIQSFNAELKQVVEHFGAHIVDIYGSAITMADFDTYIGDGRVHPNKLGMDAYTEAFKRALIANTAYMVTTHTVSMELDGVTADYGDDKIVRSGDGYTLNLTAADTLDVTVTMGGEDITATAYAGGTVSIRAVTADVTIIAKSVHQAKNYRWEFNGTDLACVSGGNALTKNAGTTTDGVFSSTRYALQTPVVLSHDQPWSVEWKCEGTFLNANGSSGARVFTSDDVNANYNARYIFKSNTNGIIAMGEKTTTGSHNYGIALADHGIDWTALHTYRLENRIAADGSNMVYLYVDGAEIGPMNHYYVGTTDKKTTSDWLSGKDFVLAYMGTDTHGFTNCSIDYIQVWEGGKPEEKTESLSLRYDDHYDISGKTVEIVEAGTPTSYQVGYGVAEKTLDTAVIIIEGNHLVATGIGTAKVRIDGTLYEVTVTAAPISLLLLAGQSMMQGSEGDANQSIICPDGMVYATYGDRYTMTVDNATNFAPSALTGAGSTLNVNGNTTNLADWPVYLLNEAGAGKAGPDSGFAYEWVKQTGEKVWVVNAAHGGTSINAWQDGGTQYEECVALFSACQETLRREIAAGHYTLSHMGYFWRQGAADELQTAQWYVEKFLAMHEDLKTELACDLDGDGQEEILEFANISMEMAGHVGKTGYRYEGGRYDPSDSTFFSTYEELELRGHRVAQYWMAANPELTDINLVFNADAQWLTMPDGSNGVEEYFLQNYPNGTVDYTTQVKQKDSWYSPKTPLAVKDSIHFNQIGFNEMGIVSARNALILLGELEDTQEKTTVTFHNWTGYETVSSVEAKSIGAPGTLVVPIVSPCYRAKEVTYEVSEGLRYEYYDLLADAYNTNGTLTAVGAQGSVSVTEASLSGYRWDLQDGVLVSTGETENVMTRLEGSTENGIFIDTRYQMARPFLLYHDQDWMLEWKMTGPWTDADSTAGKKLFSGDGRQYSEAFSISTKGNEEWLAFNYYNGSSHVHYGIDLAEHGLSLADTHIYRLYNEVGEDGNNVIWLAVDGTVLGPMDTHLNAGVKSDYLSGKDLYFGFLGTPKYWLDNGTIDYICVMETGASEEDIHFHDYSDWETVSVPTAETLGEQKRVCEGCGETQTREVEGSWQKHSLNDHMAQLPETLCGGVNLWSVLEHDLEYFSSNYAWAVHSSGKTASVTIPVKPGDRIYATSFGKAGENGGTKDGIRLTFFDAYDVCSSMAPENTYAEFTANGGYIVAPEGAVAANISMWTREDSNELYILNREHNYKSAITDPNCTEKGYTTHTCSGCGNSYVDSYTDALGHTDMTDKAVEATCTATGLTEGKYCSVCKTVLVKQEVIPAKGHTEVIDAVVEATCTATGLSEGKHCSVCKTVLVKQETIPAKGHTQVIDKAVAATCTESGLTEGKHCSVCNTVLVKQEVISAKGHTEVIDKAIEATCTTTGLTEGKHCSDCGTVLVKQQVIPAKGHTEVIDKAMEATCTEAGLTEGKHCSVCDAVLVKQEVIPAKGHTEVIDQAVEATCTTTGLTEGKHCSVCNTVLVKQKVIPAKGHVEVVDQAVAATCTESGLTGGKHCSACNTVLVKQKVIPAKGHMEVIDKAMEATCTEAGLTEGKHCSVCNTVLVKPSVIPPKGHVWNGGTCSVCGQTQGYRIDLDAEALGAEDSVWIDGVEYPAALDGRGWHAMLDHTDATNLVIYTYNDPGAQDVHTQYPIGMKVWTLHFENGAYTARYVPEFDNLLQYSGSSIRIVGVKGIRMITSIDKATRQALAGDGLAGYTLVEYGTAVAWDEDLGNTNPLVLGQSYTKSNFAYRQDVADPIIKDTGSLLQYTNVLVGFTDDQCIPDLAMRPYIILEDADGRQITIYGGIVCRSIGYIAWQNRAAFPAGSAAYEYVWSIIRHVYGDRYDAEYKG